MKKSIFLAALTVGIWGTLSTATKILVKDLPNMEVLAISSAIATLSMFFISGGMKQLRHFKEYDKKQYGIMAALGFLGIFLHAALYYYGLSQLTSQVACIINYLWPMSIILLSAPILREKITGKKLIAVITSFAGVIILVGGSGFGGNRNAFLGIGACLLGALSYGLYSVLNKRYNFNQNVFMTVSWAVSAVSAASFGLATEKWVMLDLDQWIVIAYLGVIVYAVAYLAWSVALNGAKNTALISNMAYLVPVLSIGVGALVLHEKIDDSALIALLLIVGGILLQSIKLTRKGHIGHGHHHGQGKPSFGSGTA